LLVSSGEEGFDLLGVEQPKDEILEEPEQDLPMHARQRASRDGGGKSLSRRQRQGKTLKHEKAVGQHDEGQMSMQSIPTASLVMIQTTFLLSVARKIVR
jgi:hypothetical protein